MNVVHQDAPAEIKWCANVYLAAVRITFTLDHMLASYEQMGSILSNLAFAQLLCCRPPVVMMFRELVGRFTHASNRFCGAIGIILDHNHDLIFQCLQQGSTGWWHKFLNRSKVVPFNTLALGLAVKVLSKLLSDHCIASKWL